MLARTALAVATFWIGVAAAIIVFAVTVNWQLALIVFAVGLILAVIQAVLVERKFNSEFDKFNSEFDKFRT